MNKSNAYWKWDKEISHETCQKIINLGKGKWEQATTAGSQTKFRKSNIIWIREQWVYNLIWNYMLAANEQAGWKYNMLAVENCQLTQYDKSGFYSWHRDGSGSHNEVYNTLDNKFLYGNTRKLSMSILLNSDFEGGEFEISLDEASKDNDMKLDKGSIIVFPSFIEHRVKPVTKGTRYSLVCWFVGPPFI